MKIEIKEHDYFKREHTVSYNFTVRTNGYNSWKIDLEVKCNDEKFNCFYYANKETIDWLMECKGDENKAEFLQRNLKPCVAKRVYDMLCDFPRYKIKPIDDNEVLCTARTYSDAEDEQSNFSFETEIIDTWKI